MDKGKPRHIFDIKKAGKSLVSERSKKLPPIIEHSAEEGNSFDQQWDAFREQERIYNMTKSSNSLWDSYDPQSPIENKSFATLHRLEDEDVIDKNNSIKMQGDVYFEVVDPELKNFFKETFGKIDELSFTSDKFIYIGREDRIFRKPICATEDVDELNKKEEASAADKEEIDLLASKFDTQLKTVENVENNRGARPKTEVVNTLKVTPKRSISPILKQSRLDRKCVNPSSDWQENIYSSIAENLTILQPRTQLTAAAPAAASAAVPAIEKLSIETGWQDNLYKDILNRKKPVNKEEKEEKYIEASFLNIKKCARKGEEEKKDYSTLSLSYLDKLSEEVNELLRKEFLKLKEKYVSQKITLDVSTSQFCLSKEAYDREMQKPNNKNEQLVVAHLSLQNSVIDQKNRLSGLGKQLVGLAKRKSPYFLVNEISMPKFGNKDTFDVDDLKMFPCCGTDDDISVKQLFEMLSSWAEDLGLSEKALKRAIFSRLKGSRAKAWWTYQKQPLKEAITSLSLLFDKNENPQKWANEIKNFRIIDGEDIQNSLERLMTYVNKYLENRPEDEKKILRLEIIKDKLETILSSRAQREVFRMIEERRQLGEEVTEKELLSSIYKEDMFDKRSEASSSGLRLHNVNVSSIDQFDVVSEDCDNFDDFNLELNAAEHKRKLDYGNNTVSKQFKPDRKILNPVRKIGPSSAPIVVGNQGKPLIRIGNPNPNNRWHNRPTQNPNPALSRSDFMKSRNAPLQYRDTNFKPKVTESSQQPNNYSNAFYQKRSNNLYPNFRGNQQYRQNRYGTFTSRGGLRHNLQFRTNPPAIFQQISVDELNSICMSCPENQSQHTVGQCPNQEVFRRAPNQPNQT